MKIVISPYSRSLRSGKRNAKNYPHWEELVELIKEKDHEVIQIGTKEEIPISSTDDFLIGLPLKEIAELISNCDLWISVDNFLPHFCNFKKIETQGIVIFSKSNPDIFGYPQNKNVFKSRRCFRKEQFAIWEEQEYDPDAFIAPHYVMQVIDSLECKIFQNTESL